MYLAIDIGGTKTFLASLTNEGVITERLRFETPKKYSDFLRILEENVAILTTKEFVACGVGVPGKLNNSKDRVIAFGNLPWKDTPLQTDIKKLVTVPTVVENDAKLAGLSEAMLVKEKYRRVLYITISTGIGTALIIDQKIDPGTANSESGFMMLEHHDKLQPWEDFASGRAIVEQFGKRAEDITDEKSWKQIANNIAIGLIDLLAFMQPDVVIFGGGVGQFLDRFKKPLTARLKQLETPLVPIPPLTEAKRPENAVLYGCYDLARSVYGRARP